MATLKLVQNLALDIMPRHLTSEQMYQYIELKRTQKEEAELLKVQCREGRAQKKKKQEEEQERKKLERERKKREQEIKKAASIRGRGKGRGRAEGGMGEDHVILN